LNPKEMAEQFCISERTARRHIARGTTPDIRRKLGATASSTRARGRATRTAPDRCGGMGRSIGIWRWHAAVRRLARASRFTDGDLAEMRIIAGEASTLLRGWTTAVEAHEQERSRRRLLAT
jgi:hypothetical protein